MRGRRSSSREQQDRPVPLRRVASLAGGRMSSACSTMGQRVPNARWRTAAAETADAVPAPLDLEADGGAAMSQSPIDDPVARITAYVRQCLVEERGADAEA